MDKLTIDELIKSEGISFKTAPKKGISVYRGKNFIGEIVFKKNGEIFFKSVGWLFG